MPEQMPTPDDSQVPDLPVTILRDHRLKCTIWDHEGHDGSRYTFELTRLFKSESGDYCESHEFTADELPRVGLLLQRAYAEIHELCERNRESRGPNNPEP